MSEADFKALIDANGGDASVLGIIFDNSTRIYFTPEMDIAKRFDYASMVDATTSTLKFVERDGNGYYYLNCKPIDTVQSVLFSMGGTPHNEYALRYLG